MTRKEKLKELLLEYCDPKVKYDGISADELATIILKELDKLN